MRFIMNDTGEVFDVASARQLVDELRSTSWEQCASLDAWMRDTASRWAESMDVKIDTSSPEAFVNSMVACGMAKEKPDDNA